MAEFNLANFEVVKNVTRDFFVIPEDGTAMYLRFDSAFAVDESITIKTRKSTDDKKEPMEIADVVNLATGEEGRLIGNAVIKEELRRAYPNDGYVSKMFEIKQGQQKTGRGGNKYRTFKLTELRPKSDTGHSTAQQNAKPVGKK